MMRKTKGNIILLVLAILFIILGGSAKKMVFKVLPDINANAKTLTGGEKQKTVDVTMQRQSVAGCSIGTAEKYVANQLKLKVTGSGYGAYRDALVNAQILLPTELSDTKKNITKGELALLAARIMAYKGEKEDAALSETIVSKKRISDLAKLKEPYKSCAVFAFGEGVMVGSSNGAYSQSRKFTPSEAVTAGAMKSVILRALGKKERSIMSPDGQLTRTTNLPNKYKRYKHILASFPNSYYDLKMQYDVTIYGAPPKYLDDYCFPKDMDKVNYDTYYKVIKFKDMYAKYGEQWVSKIENNLKYRLNFDYKTVDDGWVEGLAATYYIPYGEKKNPDRIAAIKKYVQAAKKNKITVTASKIVVEPSTIHLKTGDFYVRCYVKFKVTANTIYDCMSHRQYEMIYSSSEGVFLKGIKSGIYYEGVFDVPVSGKAAGDDGHNFAISSDELIDWAKA